MTPEERIAQLEEELAQVKQHTAETRDCFLEMAGAARAFECAVLALLASAKHPDEVGSQLTVHLERLDAELVCASMSDAHLEGAQRASEVLIAALEYSRTLSLPSLSAPEQVVAVEPEPVAAESDQGGWVH